MVDKILTETGIAYALQHTTYNKVRFGIPRRDDITEFWEWADPE